MTAITFTTKDGEKLTGILINSYFAYEGGKRYVVDVDGRQYRLIKNDAGYIEYVV